MLQKHVTLRYIIMCFKNIPLKNIISIQQEYQENRFGTTEELIFLLRNHLG